MGVNAAKPSAGAWSDRGGAYAASETHRLGPSLPKLLELARPLSTDVCLDLGAGAGHTAAALAGFAGRVVALDPAEGMRDAARAGYGHLPNLEIASGSGESSGQPSGTFDIVTARHTMHHHPSVPDTLREVRRILKPGGRLVIVDEVTPSDTVDVWYDLLERSRDHTHVRAYSLDEWRRFVQGSGLEWIAGDADTRYSIVVEDWLERMSLENAAKDRVRGLLRDAPAAARRALDIEFRRGEPVSFQMPMAVILAVKPRGE